MAANRVIEKTKDDKDSNWNKWCGFCRQVGQTPYLATTDPKDRIYFFLVFALRYRRDEFTRYATARTEPIGRKRVSTVLQAVGERFTVLDMPDPRLLPNGNFVPKLKWLFAYFDREDPAPKRVWPANLRILRAMHAVVLENPTEENWAALDLAIMAFFYLCRPGEYAKSPSTTPGLSKPFTLQDARFSTNKRSNLSAVSCDLNEVSVATHGSLTFTDQKNATKDETVGHSATDDPIFCPVRAVGRRVAHLRKHNAPPNTPLYTVYPGNNTPPVAITTGKHITPLLRQGAARVQDVTGIPPEKLQAYSLRSGGATALLCADTDPFIVQLLGRWNSDAMLRYLRAQAIPVTAHHSKKMLHCGNYTFIPTTGAAHQTVLHHHDIPSVLRPDEEDPELDVALLA